MKPKYKRVLLKLSGEALEDKSGKSIIDSAMLGEVADVIKKSSEAGISLALIVGAGNIWRGRQGDEMDRCTADHMGMLATVINALALKDALLQKGLKAHVLTAVAMNAFCEAYSRDLALRYLDAGEIVIFGAGLGMPFVSTDTAAAVRAAEIGADIILFAKNIDGVYSADPKTDPTAVHYDRVTYDFVLEKNLRVMDQTAASFCRDTGLDILMFELKEPENIYKALLGEAKGTVLSNK